jgi:hypothetical protein
LLEQAFLQPQHKGISFKDSVYCCGLQKFVAGPEKGLIVVQKERLGVGILPEPSPFGLTLLFPRLQLAIVVFVFTKL